MNRFTFFLGTAEFTCYVILHHVILAQIVHVTWKGTNVLVVWSSIDSHDDVVLPPVQRVLALIWVVDVHHESILEV